MNVLVYYEGVQQRVAQRTVALLAKKFAFDVDLLSDSPIADVNSWSKAVRGQTSALSIGGAFEQAVAKACSAKSYDLVVAAPNDRRGLVRMVLGSRIGRLVGSAPATIWVPRGEQATLERIVVGVSGGPQSEQDARLAARLAVAYQAKLEIIYVASQLPLFYTTFEEFHEALERDATLAAMAPGVGELQRIYLALKDEGVDVSMHIRSGTVADELASVCQGEGKQPTADLLVIGAHAPRNYAGSDYLENLAEEITESVPCPTLVVHATSDWTEWEMAA